MHIQTLQLNQHTNYMLSLSGNMVVFPLWSSLVFLTNHSVPEQLLHPQWSCRVTWLASLQAVLKNAPRGLTVDESAPLPHPHPHPADVENRTEKVWPADEETLAPSGWNENWTSLLSALRVVTVEIYFLFVFIFVLKMKTLRLRLSYFYQLLTASRWSYVAALESVFIPECHFQKASYLRRRKTKKRWMQKFCLTFKQDSVAGWFGGERNQQLFRGFLPLTSSQCIFIEHLRLQTRKKTTAKEQKTRCHECWSASESRLPVKHVYAKKTTDWICHLHSGVQLTALLFDGDVFSAVNSVLLQHFQMYSRWSIVKKCIFMDRIQSYLLSPHVYERCPCCELSSALTVVAVEQLYGKPPGSYNATNNIYIIIM